MVRHKVLILAFAGSSPARAICHSWMAKNSSHDLDTLADESKRTRYKVNAVIEVEQK